MISNDNPISEPKDDLFGVDPFAQAVAKGIENLSAPEGTVLALTGAWGSGKSSAVNLVVHHLKSVENLEVISFNPWWYSSEDLLTKAFFQHLYAGLGKSLSEKGRAIILALSKKVLNAGTVISTVANFFTFGLGGEAAKEAASAAADFIKADRTAEQEVKLLGKELGEQQKRFLIVIDDIDRLTPEQTLLVFRLVKSVGRLPNVIYLLVFDRELAERVLQEHYPAERHFLEKIVQASFEVPLADPEILHEALLHSLVELAGHPEQKEGVRFRNILIDVVNPLISLPRDLGRFLGNFSVSWAAIGKEVDLADLVAVEALRLFRLPVYQAIRSHKTMLCGTSDSYSRQRNERESYDAIFLSSASNEGEKEYVRTALRRLFPRLDSVWSNVHYSSSGRTWRAQRRICDPGHFSSYFRLALGNGILPRKVIDELFESLGDCERIKEFFRERAKRVKNNGSTEIPIIFDDILGLSDRVSKEQAANLLRALFVIADEIDLEGDEAQGQDTGNQIRLHWVVNELVRERLSQAERSALFSDLVPDAALGWAVSLVSRIYFEHHPRAPDRATAEDARLVDEPNLSRLVEIVKERLRVASEDGELLKLRHFLGVLYRWRECFGASEEDIHRWTDSQLENDRFILRMAEAVTTTSWRTNLGFDGMGDRVSRAVIRVQLDGMDRVMNVLRFLERVNELAKRELQGRDNDILVRFQEGMRNAEADPSPRIGSIPIENQEADSIA